jgi:hypothetical protein
LNNNFHPNTFVNFDDKAWTQDQKQNYFSCMRSMLALYAERKIKECVHILAGHVTRMGEKRNAYRLLVGKPEGRRPLGRPSRRWFNNIRMNLIEVGWGVVDWIGLAQDRGSWRAVVNSVLNLRVPYNAGKLSSVLTTTDLSSSAQLHGVS